VLPVWACFRSPAIRMCGLPYAGPGFRSAGRPRLTSREGGDWSAMRPSCCRSARTVPGMTDVTIADIVLRTASDGDAYAPRAGYRHRRQRRPCAEGPDGRGTARRGDVRRTTNRVPRLSWLVNSELRHNGGYLRDSCGQRSSRSASVVPERERPDRRIRVADRQVVRASGSAQINPVMAYSASARLNAFRHWSWARGAAAGVAFDMTPVAGRRPQAAAADRGGYLGTDRPSASPTHE